MENNSIYRFLSFDSFVDLIQRKELAFVHHDLWEDPYEGFLFKAITDPEGLKRIDAILKKHSFRDSEFFKATLLLMRDCMHGQSWSQCPESDALWRIYAHENKSIRIEVKKENISQLKEVTQNEIIYSDFYDLEEEILSMIGNNKVHLGKVLLRKRTAFKHEEEIRLLTNVDLSYLKDNKTAEQRALMNKGLQVLRDRGQISEAEFQTGWSNNNKTINPDKVKYIGFKHIDNFIESILLHPLSPDWFVETVQMYCKLNNIRYLGKSKLYTFSIGTL